MNSPEDDSQQAGPEDPPVTPHVEAVPEPELQSTDLVPRDGGEATPAENKDLQLIAELLPPEKRAKLFKVIREESMSHSGWLPTPDFMRQYEEVLPGLAERIVAMPEREQAFRHETMSGVVDRDYKLRGRGQWLGMAALIIILAFCVFLALIGQPTAAAWVAGVVIVGTVGVFVTGQLTGASNNSTSKDEVEGEG